MKVAGRAILTTNAIYSLPDQKELFEQHPDVSSFKRVRCFIDSMNQKPEEITCGIFPCGDSPEDMERVSLDLYQRKSKEKWSVDIKGFSKLDVELQRKVKEVEAQIKQKIRSIKNGKVQIVASRIRIYSPQNLAALCKKHGFEVETTFITDSKAHLVHGDPFKDGGKVGVVIRKPDKSKLLLIKRIC